MEPEVVLVIILVALIGLVVAGLHIGIVLGMVSLGGTFLLFDDLAITMELANQAAYAVLRNSVFAAIPLFVLMGEFMSRSGMARDLYKICNYFLRALPGRLAVATVFGNAVFAAVTGVSIASAMAFSRISYPEMRRFGYRRSYALGAIAGSSSLGMLIPPSVLLIVWGIVIEESIGKLFLAGFIPGLILAALMGLYCAGYAKLRPEAAPSMDALAEEPPSLAEIVSGFGVVALILLVLGGLFAGLFTPSESAAVGCGGALLFSAMKRLKWVDYRTAIIDSGKTIAPILFLLMTASMYAKFLALGGIIGVIQDFIDGMGLGPFGVTILMILILARHGDADRFDLDHPAHGADLLAARRGRRLEHLRVRDLRDSRHRGGTPHPALRAPGLHREGGGARPVGHAEGDLRRLDPLLDSDAGRHAGDLDLAGDGDLPDQVRAGRVRSVPGPGGRPRRVSRAWSRSFS